MPNICTQILFLLYIIPNANFFCACKTKSHFLNPHKCQYLSPLHSYIVPIPLQSNNRCNSLCLTITGVFSNNTEIHENGQNLARPFVVVISFIPSSHPPPLTTQTHTQQTFLYCHILPHCPFICQCFSDSLKIHNVCCLPN